MAIYTREQCIERLAQWVEERNKQSAERQMLLRISGNAIVGSNFFNYGDVQKMTHILQRTSCEWWIYPGHECVELHVRFF